MRAFLLAIALLASGCGYYLAGSQPGLDAGNLAGRLSLKVEDPFALTTRIIQERLEDRDLAGTGLELVIDEFSISRRELADLATSVEYELQATLIYGLRVPGGRFVLGPDTLVRDSLLVLDDANSDTLDSNLESLKAETLYRELVEQMLERIIVQGQNVAVIDR